jgi:DNA-binding HxlR family transcriptional regulator
VGRAARILDGRWTTRIVRDLLPGKRRYSELLRALAGISPKVLAARLRFLEDEEILRKTTYPEVPPRTEYALTTKGRRLQAVIEAMAKFGATIE